jgi:chromosome segregation ATPase
MILQFQFAVAGRIGATGPDPRLRGYNHLTALGRIPWEDSIATQKDLRHRLEELASLLDQKRAKEGSGSRVIEFVLSPFRRAHIDPIADVLRRAVDLLLDYDAALAEVTETVESSKLQTDSTAKDVESLRGDSRRTIEHLAALQKDHDGIREHLPALQKDHDKIREHLAAFQKDHDKIREHLPALQKDHDKIREHLVELQKDHTRLRGTVTGLVEGAGLHGEALNRLDDLWTDLHRDMTALAEALSRRDDG